MGLPEILIDFKTQAETAVIRSENGIVALILDDTTKQTLSATYVYEADIPADDWTAKNRDYIKKTFLGTPNKVILERRLNVEDGYAGVLVRLKNKEWDYLAVPGIENKDVQSVYDWILEQRAAKRTFKAVLPCTTASVSANDEGIINFSTEEINVSGQSYTSAEYCCRIAGLLAGTAMTESATYSVLAEITSIKESETPDTDINEGKFILINDGEKIKVGRSVNSLHILSGDKTEDMSKIKIVEAMDLMRKDIRTTFENNYIGINNSYDNKMLFVGAVKQYFNNLELQGVLDKEADNTVDIDVDAQRQWLAEKYDVSGMSDSEIRVAKTGSLLFVKASVTFLDAMEDLHFSVLMS